MFDDERAPPRWAIRILGGVLCLTALAAGYALLSEGKRLTDVSFISLQFAAFVVASVIAIGGGALGAMLALTSWGKPPKLPTSALWAGAALLILAGIVNTVLFVVERVPGALDAALLFGFGGSIAAVRLALRRRRIQGDHRIDGA
jgi:hypothetical protein